MPLKARSWLVQQYGTRYLKSSVHVVALHIFPWKFAKFGPLLGSIIEIQILRPTTWCILELSPPCRELSGQATTAAPLQVIPVAYTLRDLEPQ